MTLITDNLTKGNRKTLKARLSAVNWMQWLGILFSWCPQVVLESTALITVFSENARISIFGK